MQRRIHFSAAFIIVYTLATFALNAQSLSSEQETAPTLKIGQAAVCETVKEGVPVNPAVAFSIDTERLYCYTDFVTVPEKTLIYHVWYQGDQQRASMKLVLRPPRWATYSYIQLREKDKGPWRVEITDEQGNLLQTLRFSIID